MEEKRSFGEYIRKKRQEGGLTQRELAERLFVAESTVSKWERGLSYPDVSLIPEVCRQLSISEHEFFTACDDDKAHAQAREARLWRGLTKGWQWFFALSYAIAIVCFICDLAVFKRLDWFWIVLTSLMLAFCFTNLPMLVKKNRLPVCLGAATGALFLLLLVCWLYTGGAWVLGGLAITAACKNVDAAWSFVRNWLTEDYQTKDYMYEFPTNRHAFETMAERAMTQEYTEDPETGEQIPVMDTYWFEDGEVQVGPLTQEEYDAFMRLYESCNSIYSYDEAILNIIKEEIEPFFDGQKTAEETARLIQNRVSLYVAEQG